MRVEFYGASDDLIEIRIDGKDHNEIGGYISGDGYYSRALEVCSIGGAHGVRVHAIYDGCWSFAVGQLAECVRLPRNWTISVEQEHDYSTRLVIVTDDLAIVTREGGKPLRQENE